VERGGHVADFHAGEVVAIEAHAGGTDVGSAEPGAGGEHDDAGFFIADGVVGFGDATHVAVVSKGEGEHAAGCLREGGDEILFDVPAVEAVGKVGSAIEHSVAAAGAGDGEADAGDLRPFDLVFGHVFADGTDPCFDDAFRAAFGTGGALEEVAGENGAVFSDGGDLRGGGTAIDAEEKGIAHGCGC